MLFGFIRSVALVIPVLGLISCTVYKEKDPWQRKVHAEWIENRRVHTESLTALTAPTVPVDAKLVFDDTEISTGSFSSVCKSTTPEIAKARRSGNLSSSSIVVAELLSKEIWNQLGWTPESTVSCSFQFDVANSAGSTWSFKISSMTIKRLDQLVNLTVSQPPTGTWASLSPPYSFDGFNKTTDGLTTVDLICDKFRNTTTVTQPTLMSKIAQDLVHGKVALQFGSDDQRDLFQDQNCKIAIEATDTAGAVTHRLTQTFAVEFSDPFMTYEIGDISLPLGEQVADETGAVVLKMTVTNNSHNPQRFQIYQAQGNNIALQAVVSDPYKESYLAAPETFAHLKYLVSGASPVGEDLIDPIYELSAGQSSTITAQLQRDYHCMYSEYLLGSPELYRSARGLYVGTFYRFTAGKILAHVRRQIGKTDVQEVIQKINNKGLQLPYGAIQGWSPIERWEQVRGGSPVSPLVQVPTNACAPKGQVIPLKVF